MMVYVKIVTFKKLLLVWWVFFRIVSILFKMIINVIIFYHKRGS